MIKTQLEDVARIIASQPVPEPIVVHIPYAPVTPEVKEEKKVEEAKEEAKKIEEIVEIKAPVVSEAVPAPLPTPVSAPLPLDPSQILEQSEKFLLKLLKVLHVCSRYEQSVGKSLPPSVDFFGKTLLGMTSIR